MFVRALELIPCALFVQRAFKKRKLAFYGGEDELLSPDDVVGEQDAREAVDAGSSVHDLCERLVSGLTKQGAQSSGGQPR